MCGIHFILDKNKKIQFQPIWNMVNVTLYRGEERGVVKFIEKENYQLFFGHNYLRITDKGNYAQQPFTSEKFPESRLIFNGEIYNHLEIRKKWFLKDLSSLSDTVTLFSRLQSLGVKGITELNGMFAFVFWNGKEIIIGRDIMGIKPLYFFDNDDFLILSSESKAILASGLLDKKLHSQQLSHYLQFKFAKPNESFFENIQEVEKGAIWSCSEQQNWQIRKEKQYILTELTPKKDYPQYDYRNKTFHVKWHQHIDFSLEGNNQKELKIDAVKKLDELLFQSVQRQLQSEFPCGLFLSGGVDSTLLLAYIQESAIGGREMNFPCFTIINTQNKNLGTEDEQYSKWACEQFGGKQYPVEVGETILEEFPNWIQCLDEPIGDGAMFLTWLLAREAKKEVRMIFSGAGADELFGGYRRHQAFYYYKKYQSWFQRFPPQLIKKIFPRNSFLHQILTKIYPDPIQTFKNFTRLGILREGVEVRSQKSGVRGQESEVRGRELDSRVQDVTISDYSLLSPLLHDQQNYLPADVLKLTDLMTMQFQIETRVPYLDDEVLVFANAQTWEYWLQYGKKWILKELLTRKGGRKISQRKKEGFGVPLTEWLRKPKYRDLWQPVFDKKNILYESIDYESIHQLIQAYWKGNRNFNQEVWAILVLTWWLEENFA